MVYMKIFALVASREAESNTLEVVQEIRDCFVAYGQQIEMNIFTPNDYVLDFSSKPRDAFIYGTKISEESKTDDYSFLKKKMEESDLFIFATPTYYSNVSSDMKLFIDRYCHLAHLFYFAGKPFISVVTSDGAGHTQVSSYLKVFGDGLGLVRIGETFKIKNSIRSGDDVSEVVKRAIHYYKNPRDLKPSANMEMRFLHWKKQIQKQPPYFSEYEHWEKHGMFSCTSLQDYFLKLGEMNE